MKLVQVSCVALALVLAACSKSEAGETAQHAVDAASKSIESVDFSKLAPDALADKAKSLLDELSAQLSTVKDSPTAKDLVTKFEPAVEQLSKLGSTLASQKLDMTSIKKAIADVIAKFKDNPEVMGVLQPLLDKLHTLTA